MTVEQINTGINSTMEAERKKKGNGIGEYSVTLKLPSGRHEYKFVVGDNWCADPKNPEVVPNDCGSNNSIIDGA